MGQAHQLVVRERIVELRKEGLGLKEIGTELSISYGSTRAIYQAYSVLGAEGLIPLYKNSGNRVSDFSQTLKEACLAYKRLHPLWGAPRLRVDLAAQYGEQATPCIRTLQRWYRQEGLSRPNRQKAEPCIGQSRAVHNIWQVDAKENLVLADGTEACYLTMTDEKSGAWLAAPVFPPQAD